MHFTNKPGIPLQQVYIKAPICGVDKIIGVGLNYRDHCVQKKVEVPKIPMFFSKFSSTLIGPYDPLLIRTFITQVH